MNFRFLKPCHNEEDIWRRPTSYDFPWQPAMVIRGDQPNLASPNELPTTPSVPVVANNAISADKYMQNRCSRSLCARSRSENGLLRVLELVISTVVGYYCKVKDASV